jgi:ribulose-5-phosphate 4-epimerase/fuculose-1-phosphate aldolase
MSERDDLEIAINDLVIANRILGNENVMDASGHVSVRHPHDPSRYLMSQSRSPQLVDTADIMEFTLDNEPIGGGSRPLYHERFIHGAIYKARPEIKAVVHAHSEDVLPFTVTKVPLRPVIGSASAIGHHVPLWDIRDRFGDHTNLLVSTLDHGTDLATCLGEHSVVLLRGHGFAAARDSLIGVVRMSIFLPRNARVLMNAMRLGGDINALSPGEIDVKTKALSGDAAGLARGWEYWAVRAGCADLLAHNQAKLGERHRREKTRSH